MLFRSGADRLRLYVNGSRVTTFSSSTDPSPSADSQYNTTAATGIGRSGAYSSLYFDGYLADIYFIDGQALTPTSFGAFDATTGVWNPVAYSGSYGTNGFHLPFSDNSAATATGLGKDTSGNGNNWTPNNLQVTGGAAIDSLVDSPTNGTASSGGDAGGTVVGNYATLNPLKTQTLGTFSNGNLDYTQTSAGNQNIIATMSVGGSAKWYWEITLNSTTNSTPGISPITEALYPGNGNGFGWEVSAGAIDVNGARTAGQPTATAGDVIGFAFDASTYQLRIYKNGTQTSFSPVTVTSGIEYFPAFGTTSGNSAAGSFNFGQRPFAYAAPAGFKSLNTAKIGRAHV